MKLFLVGFSGHPDLKRIFLWEGFPGHPLRKDFLAMQGGYKPGLQRFPYEFPEGQREYPNLQEPGGPRAPSVPRLVGPLPGQAAAQVTTGGQLGVGGGGSNETRSPRSDYVPPSEALQIEAPEEDEATPNVSAEEQTEAVNEESSGEEKA
jgi:NADH-quinone oxidoreductase subunit C